MERTLLEPAIDSNSTASLVRYTSLKIKYI